MLAFKLIGSDYFEVDPAAKSRNIPKDAVVFGINYPYNDSKWAFLDVGGAQGRRLIRGGNTSNIGLAAFTDLTAFATTTDGAHQGSFDASKFTYNSSFNGFRQTGTGGEHSHTLSGSTMTSALSNSVPVSIVVSSHKALTYATNVLPANSIVFAAEKPGVNYNLLSNDNVNLVSGNSSFILQNVGTIHGNNSIDNISVSVSSSGFHEHPNTATSVGTVSTNPTTFNLKYYVSSGGHTHNSMQINAAPTTKSLLVKPWIVSQDTEIANGIILGYVGSVASLPVNWYVCNGQIINQTTTPDFINIYPKLSTTSHSVASGSNTGYLMSYSTGNTLVNHTHISSNFASIPATGTEGAYHGSFDWYHSHNAVNQFVAHQFPSYNMLFIIYLP